MVDEEGMIEACRPRRDLRTAIYPQVQYALCAHYDRLVDDPKGYLRNLERFFCLGIRNCHLLWYAIMVELFDFCREVDTHHSRQVQDVILRDSVEWKDFPPLLRDRLDGSLSMQRTVS